MPERLRISVPSFGRNEAVAIASPHITVREDDQQRLDEDSTPSSLPQPKELTSTRQVRTRAFWIAVLIVTLAMLEDAMFTGPKIKYLELFVCRGFYQRQEKLELLKRTTSSASYVRDGRCSLPGVQAELAELRGWISVLDTLPLILLAYPLGFVADKFGRRLVLAISTSSIILNQACLAIICLNIEIMNRCMALIPSVFLYCGCGIMVLRLVSVSIVADVSCEIDRPMNFNVVLGCGLAGAFIGPLFGRFLVEKNIWFPLIFGICVLFAIYPLLWSLPEVSRVIDTAQNGDIEEEPLISTGTYPQAPRSYVARLRRQGNVFLQESIEIVARPGIIPALIAIFAETLGGFSDILLPYSAIRFSWTLSKSSLLLSAISFSNIVAFIFGLPMLGHWLQHKRSFSATSTSYHLSLLCFALMTLGTICMALATTPQIFILGLCTWACGCEYRMILFSSITALVRADEAARLYSLALVVDSFGMLLKGPMVQKEFAVGLQIGGLLQALPIMVSAALLGLCGLSSMIYMRRVIS